MEFKELSDLDIAYFKKEYADKNKSRKIKQKELSKYFDVAPRTIRDWAKRLGLNSMFKRIKPISDFIEKDEKKNILVIGDLHEPFCLDDYLSFCKYQYERFNCSEVIFIGDIIDNHYSSYHEIDADAMGGKDELELAIKRIQRWYRMFPEATVIIGNHDRMIMRKAQTSFIPKAWIRDYKDVLKVPKWNFVDRRVVGDIQFIHGEAGKAETKAKSDLMSTVQGHYHSEAYTKWFVGANYKIFASQCGVGVDHESYAMAYAKRGKKPAIGCMVIINENLPINLMMEL